MRVPNEPSRRISEFFVSVLNVVTRNAGSNDKPLDARLLTSSAKLSRGGPVSFSSTCTSRPSRPSSRIAS